MGLPPLTPQTDDFHVTLSLFRYARRHENGCRLRAAACWCSWRAWVRHCVHRDVASSPIFPYACRGERWISCSPTLSSRVKQRMPLFRQGPRAEVRRGHARLDFLASTSAHCPKWLRRLEIVWRGGAHGARVTCPGPAVLPTISVHVTPRPCDYPGRRWLQN